MRFSRGDFAAPAASDFLNDEKVTNGPGHLPPLEGEGLWAATWGRPYADTGTRAHTVRPFGGNRTGIVGSAKPGAGVEPHQSQFSSYSGPQWGRAEPHPSTPDFARRKDFASFKG